MGGAKEIGVGMIVHPWLMVLQRCRDWGGREVEQLTVLDVSHLPPDPWGPESS